MGGASAKWCGKIKPDKDRREARSGVKAQFCLGQTGGEPTKGGSLAGGVGFGPIWESNFCKAYVIY